jgi:diacylglycerol kinase family enzyme
MLDGTVTPTDIIQVNDSYCLNVCNIGFNSKVAFRANELVAKGKSAHQAYTRGVGGEFNCAPDAKVDDGLMDVCYFRAMSLMRFLMLISLYRKGQHIGSHPGKNKVLYRQAREVFISSKDLIDIYIDGEQLPGSQFHLKILPGALPLRLPKKS